MPNEEHPANQPPFTPHLDIEIPAPIEEKLLPAVSLPAGVVDPVYEETAMQNGNFLDARPLTAHLADYPTEKYKSDGRLRGEAGNQAALTYAQQLFPDEEFSLLSDEGSGGIILDDGKGKAFKVARGSHNYSYVEDEAAALTLLGEDGLTPHLFALVDADTGHRKDVKSLYADGGTRRDIDFPDVQIPRINGGGSFPVLVMEKVNSLPIENIPTTKKATEEFFKVLNAVRPHGLNLGDVELVYDPTNERVRLIDAGGVHPFSPSQRIVRGLHGGEDRVLYPELTDNGFKDASIVRHVLQNFMWHKLNHPSLDIRFIAKAISEGGDAALAELFSQVWEEPDEPKIQPLGSPPNSHN